MLDLKKLRELWGKANQKRWEQDGEFITSGKTTVCQFFSKHEEEFTNGKANIKYTVAAANALPEALDEIERLKKEKTILAKALEQYADYGFYAFLQDPCGCHNDPTDKARTALSQIKRDEREGEFITSTLEQQVDELIDENDRLRTEIKKVIEKAKDNNPYPVDIFPELSKEEVSKLREVFKEQGINQMRLYASWGRHIWDDCLQEIESFLEVEE